MQRVHTAPAPANQFAAGVLVPGVQGAARGRLAHDGALAPQRVPRARLARVHRGHHAGPGGRRLRARAVPQVARQKPQGVQGMPRSTVQ